MSHTSSQVGLHDWAYRDSNIKENNDYAALAAMLCRKNTADEDNVEKSHRLNNQSSVPYKQEGIAEEQKELRRTGQAVTLLQTHSLLSYLAPEYNCPQILPSHHTRSD